MLRKESTTESMASDALDIKSLRFEFPVLSREIHQKKLCYVDNAASLQKPRSVIEAVRRFESHSYSNIHRSVHLLSQEATEAFELVRPKVARFLGLTREDEIVFTKGATEGFNLVAVSLGDSIVAQGDSVLVTRMEHHANFVPWQALAKRKNANFLIAELDSDFRLDQADFKEKLLRKPKIVALTAMSNVTGVITPVPELSALAKEAGAIVIVDVAQLAPHRPMDLNLWPDVDFISFSAHKLGGPNGVGCLWGRRNLLESMTPYQYGGDMILEVLDEDTRFNGVPFKFEAGTPNISGVVGFGAALDFLEKWQMSRLAEHEDQLTSLALHEFLKIDRLRLIGPVDLQSRGPLFSFVLEGVHPHDLGTFLDAEGIAVRGGHHCAQPLHFKNKLGASTRASFCFYNEKEEIGRVIEGIQKAQSFFKKKA